MIKKILLILISSIVLTACVTNSRLSSTTGDNGMEIYGRIQQDYSKGTKGHVDLSSDGGYIGISNK